MPQSMSDRKIHIIKAGYHHGQKKRGVDEAPRHILTADFVATLPNVGQIVECAPVGEEFVKVSTAPYYLHEPEACSLAARRVFEAVNSTMNCTNNNGDLTMVVGGDHSIAIGSVAAQMQHCNSQDFALLWVDAHADLNTLTSTVSGNVHGTPVSFLVGAAGLDLACLGLFDWLPPNLQLRPENLAYIGLRDLDPPEEQLLAKFGIKHWRAKDVHHRGIEAVMQGLLDYWGPDKSVYVSFDIDGLDPAAAPATGTPVPGGLTIPQGQYILKRVRRDFARFLGMDIVEVNPALARTPSELEATIAASHAILGAAFSVN
jgi:arginase